MGYLAKAIRNLRPGAEWQLEGDDLEGLEWLDEDQQAPTEREVNAEMARLEAEAADNAYRRQRRDAYTAAGATLTALLIALWEHLVEERPQEAARLQRIRETIKERFPDPNDPENVRGGGE